MKKLIQVLVLVLALNFLAMAGGVGFLFAIGKVDKTKLGAMREMVFAPPPAPEVVTTQPAAGPATQPTSKLDELLAKYSGRRAGEQIELIQQSVDAQAAALDRRDRELDNLKDQIVREKAELARKSAAIDAERKRIKDRENEQAALTADQGFQDSLKLYLAMQPKQAKANFMTMPEDTVVRYLQAMPPRTASKIIKEFKTPDEQDRIARVLERMRLGSGNPATKPAAEPIAGSGSLSSPAIAEPAGTDRPTGPPKE
jgi:flagellar motility protein MotE (MotC chaperone)